MKRKPSTEATAAWIRLMRVQSRVLDAVEQDLKKAGFPPLAWYDAPGTVARAVRRDAPGGTGKADADPAIFHLAADRPPGRRGLAARRECKIDKRGQFVEITEAGRELQKKMERLFGGDRKHVGSKLSDADAMKLCGLLDRLGCSCSDVTRRCPRRRAGAMTALICFVDADDAVRIPLATRRVRSNRQLSGFFHGA